MRTLFILPLFLLLLGCGNSQVQESHHPDHISTALNPRNRLAGDGASVVESQREIPITHRAEVIVVGASKGGLGGCMAAYAAAREGADVLLIEAGGHIALHIPMSLGIVLGVDSWKPNIQEGYFRVLAEYVVRTGQHGKQPLTLEQLILNDRIIVRYHDVVTTAWLAMLKDAGVRMLFHTQLVDTVVKNGQVQAVIVESPQGRHAIAGDVFIDSTGLANIAAQAGAPMANQEAFVGLQLFISGVDDSQYHQWCQENNEPLDPSYKAWMETVVGPFEELEYPWDQWWPEYLGDRMPNAVVRKVREAHGKGEFTLFHRRGEKGILAIPEGIKTDTGVARPRSYITEIDPLSVDDISWAEVTSRLALVEYQEFLRNYIPGFEACVLERVADSYALRGGRHIVIDDPPTSENRHAGRRNPDGIFVTRRGKDRKEYDFPYRALIPDGVEGLLVVGKATAGGSAFRTAHDVLFQGQAAGTAAALAAQQKISPRQVDIKQLQTILKANGVVIPY